MYCWWLQFWSANIQKKSLKITWKTFLLERYQADSNCCRRFCRPVPNHSAMVPFVGFPICGCKGTTLFGISNSFLRFFCKKVRFFLLFPLFCALPSLVWVGNCNRKHNVGMDSLHHSSPSTSISDNRWRRWQLRERWWWRGFLAYYLYLGVQEWRSDALLSSVDKCGFSWQGVYNVLFNELRFTIYVRLSEWEIYLNRQLNS